MKIACLLAVMMFGSLFANGNQQQNPASNNQADTRKANPQRPATVAISNNQSPTQDDKQPAEHHLQEPTWWNADRGTWALVFVGIGGTLAAIWTLLVIKRQTQHLVNAERAWIQVPEVILLQKLSFYNPPPEQFFVWLHPYIVNNGRTQARITKIAAKSALLEKLKDAPKDRPAQLPDAPNFAASDTLLERDIILSPEQGINWIRVPFSRDFLERIKQNDVSLYVYGRIDYQDLSGESRKTGFARVYSIPDGGIEDFAESADIPKAYTECT